MVRAISLVIGLLMVAPVVSADLERELEEAVGRKVADSIARKWGHCDLNRYPQAREVAKKLLSHYPKRFDYKMAVLNSNQIRSFGCPGGYILISRGLIEAAGDRDHELAFPLARQIIYANKSRLLEKMIIGTAVDVLLGDRRRKSSSKELATGLLTVLYNGRSHDREYQIDKLAMGLMIESGYSPKGALSYLRRLELVEIKDSSLTEDLNQTMPPAKERAKRVKQEIIRLYLEGTISF
jgi:beta-barrel assembly-enhancing protease